MIKFFTIIFLVYYIFRVLKPSFMVGTFNKLNEDFKAFNNAKDDKEKEEIVINRIAAILGRLVLLCRDYIHIFGGTIRKQNNNYRIYNMVFLIIFIRYYNK